MKLEEVITKWFDTRHKNRDQITYTNALEYGYRSRDNEVKELLGLLLEARGHLRGYKMSMLARGRESLLAALDEVLKAEDGNG